MQKILVTFIPVVFFSIVVPAYLSAGTIFMEDFSDNSAGWTLGTEWAIGATSVSSGHNGGTGPDPLFDHTSTSDNGVAGVVLGGNAATNLHDYYWLTSPVIDVSSGQTDVEYWRWLNSDYTPYMNNQFQVYDGSTWTTLWESGNSPVTADSSWLLQQFDVTNFANSNFQMRWGFNINSGGVYTVSGWNLDDVKLNNTLNPVPEPATMLLFGTGLIGLAGSRLRKKKK